MTDPLPCPFCGRLPAVIAGDYGASVECKNKACPAHPIVEDGLGNLHAHGVAAYAESAITRWNERGAGNG